jgi:hypothetical protein
MKSAMQISRSVKAARRRMAGTASTGGDFRETGISLWADEKGAR